MKKFFNIFFVALGVIFFIILLFIAYLFIFDPFNIKPFINREIPTTNTTVKTNSTNSTTSTTKTNPANKLSPAQADALEAVGISPDTLPTTFTNEQLQCFEAKLGKIRVDQIKAGGTPTMTEFYQAKDCI